MTSNAELIERLRACDTFVSQPQMLLIREAADVITALEERIRVLSEENERLSRTVSAGILGDLLTDNETDALVAFVKSLRQDAALNQSNDDYCGIVVVDEGEEDEH